MSVQDVDQHFIRPLVALFRLDVADEGMFLDGLTDELASASVHALQSAAVRFKRSRRYKNFPSIAECVEAVEACEAVAAAVDEQRKDRGIFSYRVPSSKCIERNLTKSEARQRVDNGVHPRGSIWLPGAFGSGTEHIGDLFGPDPNWQPAKPVRNNGTEPRVNVDEEAA